MLSRCKILPPTSFTSHSLPSCAEPQDKGRNEYDSVTRFSIPTPSVQLVNDVANRFKTAKGFRNYYLGLHSIFGCKINTIRNLFIHKHKVSEHNIISNTEVNHYYCGQIKNNKNLVESFRQQNHFLTEIPFIPSSRPVNHLEVYNKKGNKLNIIFTSDDIQILCIGTFLHETSGIKHLCYEATPCEKYYLKVQHPLFISTLDHFRRVIKTSKAYKCMHQSILER